MQFLFRDFLRFLKKYVKNSFRIPSGSFVDIGEFFITFFSVVAISISCFLFYKAAMAITAYGVSDDLLGFFTILRNVYSNSNTGLQYSLNGANLTAGLILSPALEFLSIALFVWGIRKFTSSMNSKYKTIIYSEGDKIALGFLGVLIFVFIEILFYTQEIRVIENSIVNLIYVASSKIAIISFFFAVEHSRYLKIEQYKTSLYSYFHLTNPERRVILNREYVIILTYFNSILLNIPLYFGQQVLSGVKLYAFLFANVLLFCAVLTILFRKTWNYLAVVLLAERIEKTYVFPEFEKQVLTKRWIILMISCFLPGLALLFIKPKLFVFGFIIAIILVITYALLHVLIYLFGLAVSLVRAKYLNLEIPVIHLKSIVKYLIDTLSSLGTSFVPFAIIMFFTFSLISLLPKHFVYQNPDLVNAILDSSGSPLYIEEAELNRCVGISTHQPDTLFYKLLYNQEDRQFLNQNSWLPQSSNWHGISLSGMRTFSGKAGSSNLVNQLIKNLVYRTFPQDISRKFSEYVTSYQLSIQREPSELINYYINSVGFSGGIGGNEGLLACALEVFNQPVEELNQLELFYLIRTLKWGTSYNTQSGEIIPYTEVGLHKDEIKQDLLLKAKIWYEKGLLSKREVSLLRRCELRFSSSASKITLETTTREFIKKHLPASLEKKTYYSSITFENQEKLAKGAGKFDYQFREYKRSGTYDLYTSAIAIEVKTGKIIGHYGGQGVTDLMTLNPGFPMASLIKPFILLQMLEEGLEINLFDGKLAGKVPENFNHIYSNKYVGVQEILSKSLNAPIVNIRQVTSPIELFSKVETRFAEMGIAKDPYLQIEESSRKQEIEYNYGLGSRNMKLIDIAQAYQTLFNDGRYVKLNVIQTAFNPLSNITEKIDSNTNRIYNSEKVRIIKDALTHTIDGTASTIKPILPKDRQYYIKTGTSDRSIHGYCVMSDGEIMILSFLSYGKVVDGRLELNKTPAIPLKSGGRTAAVLAANIYNELTKEN